MNLACLHFAAHERPKPDFKLDGAGTQARRTACLADLDIVQIDPRGRQDARVDRTVDVDGEAGQPARLLLECGAVTIPVDHKRGDQRRYQRQDECDGQSEQRRLHGKLPFLVA